MLDAVKVLVVNAGSSSTKLRVLDGDDVTDAADAAAGDDEAVAGFCRSAAGVDAVGHRVVHGGTRFRRPVIVDDDVVGAVEALADLAPLHQPLALAGIRAARRALPDVPAVACFDTAFHATIPPEAATYPLPEAWRSAYALRRFGFHGLSHAYASRRAGELCAGGARRVVTCHLGAGSSLAAVVDGRCVDTTMGFTTNEGVPMATRSGSVDVGMLTWLLEKGMTAGELADGLNQRSGLLGLAGTTDMRQLLARAGDGDHDARLAVDVWVLRVSQAVAAMAVSAGGIDVIVFTGGIGEGAPSLRARVAERLGWAGVALDAGANDATDDDAIVSPPGAAVTVLVVQAREDVEIARGTREALTV